MQARWNGTRNEPKIVHLHLNIMIFLSFTRILGEHVILVIQIYCFCYFYLKCHMEWKMLHRMSSNQKKNKQQKSPYQMTRATFWFYKRKKKTDTTSFDFGSIRVANDLPTHNLEYVHVYFYILCRRDRYEERREPINKFKILYIIYNIRYIIMPNDNSEHQRNLHTETE